MTQRGGDDDSFVGGRAPHQPPRSALVLAALAAACASSGCIEIGGEVAIAQSAECSVRVIVHFATEPDDGLLVDLERTNTLDLEPLGAITAYLHVLTLRAAGSDDDCSAAIDRLRRDERVRSVDLDARRGLHEDQSNTQGEG